MIEEILITINVVFVFIQGIVVNLLKNNKVTNILLLIFWVIIIVINVLSFFYLTYYNQCTEKQ
jgi:uncharacterized membrane protein YwzB